MGIQVSVVVPVYNPGPYIEPCIASLLGQTLPPPRREFIFVDDGSTDDSLARLHRLAAEHREVRVVSIPNSGWPGKPRNVGTDLAVGEYVMYVDQDDLVEPEALQRMYDLGSTNDADIVLGKVISDFRGVHHQLYRENRPSCTIYDARLIHSQTPHKMLRTAFLRQAGIRYPEGRRRLEDQLFITKAYFAASSVAIVGDYICYRYRRRPDGGNAGSTRIDPPAYYDNLREVLDVVDRYTEPGPARDTFYRRFLKTEMLGRLGGRKLETAPPEFRVQLLAEVRRLMAERFPLSVDAGLGAALRVRAGLVRDGTLADLVRLSDEMKELRAEVRMTAPAQTLAGPAVALKVAVELQHRGQPLLLEPYGDGWLLPASLTGPGISPESRRVEPVAGMAGDVVVEHRRMLDEWFLPKPLTAQVSGEGGGGRLSWSGTAILDPMTAAGGQRLRAGSHDLFARVEPFGLTKNGRIRVDRAWAGSLPMLVSSDRRRHRISLSQSEQLALRAGAKASELARTLSRGRARQDRDRVVAELATVWASPPRLRLRLTSASGRKTSLDLAPTGPLSPIWQSSPGAAYRLAPGTYRAVLSGTALPEPVRLPEAVSIMHRRRDRLAYRARRAARRLIGRLARR